MIFSDTPTQSEDGTYFVRATADDKKKAVSYTHLTLPTKA